MSDKSVFLDSDRQPTEQQLSTSLGRSYSLWKSIRDRVFEASPGSLEEWNYSRAGWNCRLKGKKCVIIYLMPQNNEFKASFVLGAKATGLALDAGLSESSERIINEAKVYAEGRGFRITVNNARTASDVKKLVDIKVASQ